MTQAPSPIVGQDGRLRSRRRRPRSYNLRSHQPAGRNRAVPATWQPEYTFTQEWHLPRVDLGSLERLYKTLQDVPEARERWHALFPVSSPVYWSRSSVGGEHQAQAMRASDAARDLFRRAAMSGYSLAQLNLAAAFDHSRLMPHNPLRAYIWYSIAARLVSDQALRDEAA